MRAPPSIRRHVEVHRRRHARRNGLFKVLFHPRPVVAVITRAREISLYGMRNVHLMAFLCEDHFILQPKLHICEHEPIPRIQLCHVRTQMIVGMLGAALRLCAVVDYNFIGVKLKPLPGHIVGADLARRLVHRPRALLIIVVDVIAVERNAHRALGELEQMCAVGNRDVSGGCIPLHIVPLEPPRCELHNIDMTLRRERARTLIVGEIVALKGDRRRLRSIHRMPQIFPHRLDIREQFLLLRRECVRTRFAAAVLDEVQMLHPRLAVRTVRRLDRLRK